MTSLETGMIVVYPLVCTMQPKSSLAGEGWKTQTDIFSFRGLLIDLVLTAMVLHIINASKSNCPFSLLLLLSYIMDNDNLQVSSERLILIYALWTFKKGKRGPMLCNQKVFSWAKLNIIFPFVQSLTIKGCVRLCVCPSVTLDWIGLDFWFKCPQPVQ